MGVSSTIVIEEIAASGNGSAPRSITLTGPSLPFMGAGWKSGNKLVTKFPSGSRRGSQQVLGPKEMPSRWSGSWHRTMMGRTPAKYDSGGGSTILIVDPHVLHEALEGILRGGLLLRVTWSVIDTGGEQLVSADHKTTTRAADPTMRGKIVREGRAAEFSFSYTRITDVDWEVEFAWIGRGQDDQQKVASVRDDSLIASAAAIDAALQQLAVLTQQARLLRSNPTIPKSAGHLTLGQLERMANAPLALTSGTLRSIQQQVSGLKRAVNVAKTVATLPIAVAGQAVAFAHNTVAVANSAIDTLTQKPVELVALQGHVSDLVRASKYYSGWKLQTGAVSRAAQALIDAVRARNAQIPLQGEVSVRSLKMQQGDILALFRAREGDTPMKVSQKYYGSPDHGRDILRANRLPLSQVQLPIGRTIIVPVLQTAQTG